MKQQGVPTGKPEIGRRIAGRAQDPGINDTYQLKGKLPEPCACPQCGAVYHQGHWTWSARPAGAAEVLCQACRRIADRYPAGRLTLSGGFWPAHRDEILRIVHHAEAEEKSRHPLNRIMAIEDDDGRLIVTTTDIHLPRRIGEALHRSFQGDLELDYDQDTYAVRVTWQRDA